MNGCNRTVLSIYYLGISSLCIKPRSGAAGPPDHDFLGIPIYGVLRQSERAYSEIRSILGPQNHETNLLGGAAHSAITFRVEGCVGSVTWIIFQQKESMTDSVAVMGKVSRSAMYNNPETGPRQSSRPIWTSNIYIILLMQLVQP